MAKEGETAAEVFTRAADAIADYADGPLKAGAPSEKGVGRRGSAYAYNVMELRNQEKASSEQAEKAYEHMVRHWAPKGPKRRTNATSEERR